MSVQRQATLSPFYVVAFVLPKLSTASTRNVFVVSIGKSDRVACHTYLARRAAHYYGATAAAAFVVDRDDSLVASCLYDPWTRWDRTRVFFVTLLVFRSLPLAMSDWTVFLVKSINLEGLAKKERQERWAIPGERKGLLREVERRNTKEEKRE